MHPHPLRRAGIGLVGIALSSLACGGAPRTPPAPPPDLSAELTGGAALCGVFAPARLRGFMERLGGLSPGFDYWSHNSIASLILEPGAAQAFGIDVTQPVWFSLSGGPVLHVLRIGEDLERHTTADDAFGLPEWLIDNPLPAAWLRLRLVGLPAPAGDPAAWLGDALGAVQVVEADEPPEGLATLLEAPLARAAPIHQALGRRGARLVRLLERDVPALVVIQRRGDRVIVDWLEDEDLGEGGLVAGLEVMLGLAKAEPMPPPAIAGVGPAGTDDLLRVEIDHLRWTILARMLGEVAVMHAALTREDLIAPRGEVIRQGRRAARAPERLMAAGAELFRRSTLSLRHTGRTATFDVAAHYTPRAQPLAALSEGEAPLAHAALARAGDVAVTIASGSGWGAVLAEMPPATMPLAQFLGEVLQCGVVCGPALWTAVPAYARDLRAQAATVFPELADFEAGLAAVQGASVIVRADPPSFAAALLLPARDDLTWARLKGKLSAEWVALAGRAVLRIGSYGEGLRGLIAASGTRVERPASILRASAHIGADAHSAFDHLDASLAFEPEALRARLDLRLRPALPSDGDGDQ